MATKTRKYRKVSCHKTKTAAKAAAKVLRGQKKTASVRGKCVYSAGAAKVSGIGRRKRRRSAKRK